MVLLRATAKLREHLPPPTGDWRPTLDTALGDWYGDLIELDDRPLIVLVSSLTLLPIVVSGRKPETIVQRLPDLVRRRLTRLGGKPEMIDAECHAMQEMKVGKTTDRVVLGSLVSLGQQLWDWLPPGGWDNTTLPFIAQQAGGRIRRVPWERNRRMRPNEEAIRTLHEYWGTPI